MPELTADLAPTTTVVAQSAYPSAATNIRGGNIVFRTGAGVPRDPNIPTYALDGSFLFYHGAQEEPFLRIDSDGGAFVRGKRVEAVGEDVWLAFREWVAAARADLEPKPPEPGRTVYEQLLEE